MLRKAVLGILVVAATALSSAVPAGSAHAGPLARVKTAVKIGLESDRRALHDLACGQGVKAAAKDVIGGAKAEAFVLTHKNGGIGFGKQKPC